MLYSNACGYAIRAVARLAAIRPGGYVLLEELCRDDNLPRHFLAKILQNLVRHGLLVSAKGRGGGFALARPADQITLYDIVQVIDGDEALKQCVVGLQQCDDDQPCPHHEQWKSLRQHIHQFLVTTTVAAMSQTLQRKLELIGRPIHASSPTGESSPDDAPDDSFT